MITCSITIPFVVSVRLVTYTVLIRCVREKNASAFYACEIRRVCHRDVLSFCIGEEPKSGLARDLGDCLQSRNVPFGTSGDFVCKNGIVLQGDSFFEADEKADRNSKK